MSVLFAPSISKCETVPGPNASAVSSVESEKLLTRYNEIKSMDKSKMSPTEKRSLRKEMRVMKTQAVGGGGVYISLTALLIIIILILIL